MENLTRHSWLLIFFFSIDQILHKLCICFIGFYCESKEKMFAWSFGPAFLSRRWELEQEGNGNGPLDQRAEGQWWEIIRYKCFHVSLPLKAFSSSILHNFGTGPSVVAPAALVKRESAERRGKRRRRNLGDHIQFFLSASNAQSINRTRKSSTVTLDFPTFARISQP